MNTPAIVVTGITVGVLVAGGATTNVGRWYQELRKPPWNPPSTCSDRIGR